MDKHNDELWKQIITSCVDQEQELQQSQDIEERRRITRGEELDMEKIQAELMRR